MKIMDRQVFKILKWSSWAWGQTQTPTFACTCRLGALMIFHRYRFIPTGTEKIKTAYTSSILFSHLTMLTFLYKFHVPVFKYNDTQNHIIQILQNKWLFLFIWGNETLPSQCVVFCTTGESIELQHFWSLIIFLFQFRGRAHFVMIGSYTHKAAQLCFRVYAPPCFAGLKGWLWETYCLQCCSVRLDHRRLIMKYGPWLP